MEDKMWAAYSEEIRKSWNPLPVRVKLDNADISKIYCDEANVDVHIDDIGGFKGVGATLSGYVNPRVINTTIAGIDDLMKAKFFPLFSVIDTSTCIHVCNSSVSYVALHLEFLIDEIEQLKCSHDMTEVSYFMRNGDILTGWTPTYKNCRISDFLNKAEFSNEARILIPSDNEDTCVAFINPDNIAYIIENKLLKK